MMKEKRRLFSIPFYISFADGKLVPSSGVEKREKKKRKTSISTRCLVGDDRKKKKDTTWCSFWFARMAVARRGRKRGGEEGKKKSTLHYSKHVVPFFAPSSYPPRHVPRWGEKKEKRSDPMK